MELQINFNTWVILFLVAAAQGFFLAFVLFSTFKKQKANKYLAFLMLSFGISLLYYVAYWTGISKYIHRSFYLILFLPLLYGPLLLGYFRTLNNKKLATSHWIPFLIIVLLTSFLYLPWFNEAVYPFFQALPKRFVLLADH